MQYTENYHLKKPQMSDFASIEDISENMDTIDEKLAAPTGDARDQVVSFTDADLDSGITSFPTFLTKIVSGMKLAKFLRDFKAGMAYVLHVGDLINNATCTESGKALDARMGKTLQDQITSLNDSLAKHKRRTFIQGINNPTANTTYTLDSSLASYEFIELIVTKNSSNLNTSFESRIIHHDNLGITDIGGIVLSVYNNESYNFHMELGFYNYNTLRIASFTQTGWVITKLIIVGIGYRD